MTIDDLMSQAMGAVGTNRRAQGRALTAFLGLAGIKYDRELMIVGRSVNGWTVWTAEMLGDSDATRAFIRNLRRAADTCPLAWVTAPHEPGKYNPRRSAFWRTARKVRKALTGETLEDGVWASHLAWSNLYKISNDGGNPPDWMCAAQERQCIELLHEEFRQYEPKRVLFSTGIDWAEPFVKGIGRLSPVRSSRYVEAIGQLPAGDARVPLVIATHPMRRPEGDWAFDVVSAFEEARVT